MFFGIIFFKYLRNNIDKIVEFIYIISLKNTVNIGRWSYIYEIGFVRLKKIINWIYFCFFIIIFSYIISLNKIILEVIINIFIKLFKNLQYIGKILIDIIIKYTGPLSQNVIDNIWLLYILLFILIILILSNKIIKYILKYIREYNNQKNLFKTELLRKLKEQDQIVQKQLDLIKKEKNSKNNLYYIKLYNNYYTIDISKIKI